VLPGGAAAVRQRFYITSRWNVFMIWCLKVICGIRYEIRGMENLPDAPAILLSKHQSAWETIFLLPLMPRPLVFVFKKEILYIPFFGWAMALLRMIPIDRKQGKNAFKTWSATASAAWRKACGSSCSRKGRASRSAKPASTRAAARAWPSRPARWWCRLRITPASAGQKLFHQTPRPCYSIDRQADFAGRPNARRHDATGGKLDRIRNARHFAPRLQRWLDDLATLVKPASPDPNQPDLFGGEAKPVYTAPVWSVPPTAKNRLPSLPTSPRRKRQSPSRRPLVAPPSNQPPRRQLLVGEFILEYELRRSTRRSIGFMIDDDGLRVTAPKRISIAEDR
jgi:1-acyl-sn-glycerol-3-phosphate acyltransferase